MVSVALICLVPYLKKIVLSKKCIFYCLVVLNSILCFNSLQWQYICTSCFKQTAEIIFPLFIRTQNYSPTIKSSFTMWIQLKKILYIYIYIYIYIYFFFFIIIIFIFFYYYYYYYFFFFFFYPLKDETVVILYF